jgi:hypothetical protein
VVLVTSPAVIARIASSANQDQEKVWKKAVVWMA